MGGRHDRIPVAIAPEDGVARAEHDVVGSRAAHDRLMKIVAHGVFIGELLQDGNVSRLHVVKGHRVAAAVVVDLVGNGDAVGINFAGIGSDDEGIEIAQASGRVFARGIADIAIGLLPHLVEPVRGVAGVGIVGEICSLKRERPVREIIEILNSRIEIGKLSRLCGARRTSGQEVEIAEFQGRLDCRQDRGRSARGKGGRLSSGGAGRKIQGRFRKNVIRSLLVVIEADVELGLEWRDSLELLGLLEMTAGSAVRVDDSFGQQILDGFAALGDVGGEEVVKGPIFAD